MRTIGSTLQNSPQVASFPSSSSSPTKWCRSSSLPFLGLGRSVTAMIRNEDDGCWYIPYIDWISRYCILYTYDKIYMMVYIYIYANNVFFLMFFNPGKQVFNGGQWSWAICRWSSVLLTVGAAGWVQPRTFSAFTVFRPFLWVKSPDGRPWRSYRVHREHPTYRMLPCI